MTGVDVARESGDGGSGYGQAAALPRDTCNRASHRASPTIITSIQYTASIPSAVVIDPTIGNIRYYSMVKLPTHSAPTLHGLICPPGGDAT